MENNSNNINNDELKKELSDNDIWSVIYSYFDNFHLPNFLKPLLDRVVYAI